MAKIRAYKLAEELGIERQEFLDKVRELGIELRSAMVGVDDEQVAEIRAKLGGTITEERVEKRSAGGTIIRRRRRKVAPEEAPAPVAEPPSEEPAVAAEAPPVEGEPAAAEPVAAEAPAPAAAQPAGPAQPIRPERPARPGEPPRAAPPRRPAPAAEPPARQPRQRPVRRTHNEQVKLKEQEGLARTMMGNVQHRLEQRRLIVEQQAREMRRRRTAQKAARRSAGPAVRKKKIIRVEGEASFKDIAAQTGVKVRDLVRRARALGAELEREDRIDLDTVALLADELGFEVQQTSKDVEAGAAIEVNGEDLEPRPPVVTVMGHVDHGKTSLLDTIRKSNVVSGEAGGITQHIGAYMVRSGDHEISFIDTPGHAAFTQMRARGAQVTDVVVLVVAADDSVMPQTVEAIDHARAAGVPMIVAVNKIDKGDADPQRVRQSLLEHDVVVEEFGGDVIAVDVSATKGTNVDKLLEMLALQAEVLELRARREGPARGVVVEAQLDRGRGPVATILVREGTLKRGDAFVVGEISGRVRTLSNEDGKALREATPSSPVQIVGLSGVPEAGDEFVVVKNEREAKEIADYRQSEARRATAAEQTGPSAEDIFAQIGEGEQKELSVVLKADVRGTMEAIREALEKLSTEKVELNVIHSGVGAVSESDVMLASASSAIVIGFHVRPEPAARKLAENEEVEIRTFDVVYELLDDASALMAGLLPPKTVESISGHAEVRQLFVIPRRGTVAGCFVPDGVIRRSDQIRILRDGVPIYTGPIESLRHFKDDVREIRANQECGIRIANFNDYKVGDLLESFHIEEHPETL